MSDLAERLADAQIERQSRTEQALTAMGEGTTNTSTPPAAAPTTAPPKSTQEKVGVGRDLVDETTRVVLKGLDARIAALLASQADPQKLADLRARRKLILEEAARAKQ